MSIERLDHLVLTVHNIEQTIEFYTTLLGMQHVSFGDNRHALVFGQQKINLHPSSAPLQPHAQHPTSGSADLCFITQTRIQDVISQLQQSRVSIEEGPVPRTGALGAITSVYFRDPDFNLIEVSNYD
ncbi:VOC family protein [Aquirhabdus parva]|uniref:VOC family protein n=1 Tax=Aquirhabdus parva TaxID=2283318 RepID=A0A345PBH2_9GAMM|nr:VOC family protein [Aquirhabdus parva]AXI04631.1 VOC family protein [Aquirhabdus parva]